MSIDSKPRIDTSHLWLFLSSSPVCYVEEAGGIYLLTFIELFSPFITIIHREYLQAFRPLCHHSRLRQPSSHRTDVDNPSVGYVYQSWPQSYPSYFRVTVSCPIRCLSVVVRFRKTFVLFLVFCFSFLTTP